jgi:hypothetical protein
MHSIGSASLDPIWLEKAEEQPMQRDVARADAGVTILMWWDEGCYWIALPTLENTELALVPINRTVPTTMTKITASITAYSAMS